MAAVAASLLLLLPACSDSEGNSPDLPETKYATLTITIGSADNSTPNYTKAVDADGFGDNDIIEPDSADNLYEHHIDDWYIIVLKDGNVDRVVSNNSAVSNIEQSYINADNNNENSETEVGMELLVGETYSFYALANLKGLTETNYTAIIEKLGNLKGTSFASFRETEATLREMAVYNEQESAYIPMSSYGKSHKVDEDITKNEVKLALIRLLGKVSIQVTNATGVDVTINKITMGSFRQSGNIYLMPYDAIEKDPDSGKENLLLGMGAENRLMNPVFPGATVTGTPWDYEPGTTDKTIAASATTPQKYEFYINETNQASVDPNGGDMEIIFDVTGDGLEKDDQPKSTNFFFIRRNDLLKIPVLISHAQTKIEFEQKHMPIGGLPTAITFGEGAIVANEQLTTDHGGDITVTYTLEELNGATDWALKYHKDQQGIQQGEQFCSAVLETNNNNILLPPSDENKANLSWMDGGNTKTGYKLTEGNGNTGSFTITAQELDYLGTATIKLTLVAMKDGQEVVLPYTLTITNGKTEGGNS